MQHRAQRQADLDAIATTGASAYWRDFYAAVTGKQAAGTVWDYRRAIAAGPCQCGGTGTVTPDVTPDHPAYQALPCSCVIRARAKNLHRLFDTAGIPPRFLRHSFETFEVLPESARAGKTAMLALARKFADVGQYQQNGGLHAQPLPDWPAEVRPGALFFGPCGTGKSVMSAAIAKAWQDASMSVLWITHLEFIESIQDTYHMNDGGAIKAARIKAARNVDLLVLDDLGRARDGQKAQSNDSLKIFDLVIAHRHAYERATLFTSNLTPGQLEAQFDRRLANRIALELCHVVEAGGADMRSPIGKE